MPLVELAILSDLEWVSLRFVDAVTSAWMPFTVLHVVWPLPLCSSNLYVSYGGTGSLLISSDLGLCGLALKWMPFTVLHMV